MCFCWVRRCVGRERTPRLPVWSYRLEWDDQEVCTRAALLVYKSTGGCTSADRGVNASFVAASGGDRSRSGKLFPSPFGCYFFFVQGRDDFFDILEGVLTFSLPVQMLG